MSEKSDDLAKFREPEALIQLARDCEDLEPRETEAYVDLLRWLQQNLGPEFFSQVAENGHPLFFKMVNNGAWRIRDLIWLFTSLRRLEDADSYGTLLEKVRSPQDFSEARSLIEVAEGMSEAGFAVEIEPTATVQGQLRKPDICVRNPELDESFYVEVSELGEPQDSRLSANLLGEISSMAREEGRDLHYKGKVEKVVPEEETGEVTSAFHGLLDRVRQTGELEQARQEGFYIFAAAPKDQRDRLDSWAARHDLERATLEGPPISREDLKRTRKKFRKKKAQLPAGHPNWIFIRKSRGFWYQEGHEDVVRTLQEELSRSDHVFGLVVYGPGGMWAEPEVWMDGPHEYVRKPRTRDLYQHHYFIVNEEGKERMSSSSLAGFRKSLQGRRPIDLTGEEMD